MPQIIVIVFLGSDYSNIRIFFSFQEYIACLTVVYVLGHIKRWKINDYSKSLEGNKIIR